MPIFLASDDKRSIVIEAGHKGWESIEFKEMYATAADYLGEKNISKIVYFEKLY